MAGVTKGRVLPSLWVHCLTCLPLLQKKNKNKSLLKAVILENIIGFTYDFLLISHPPRHWTLNQYLNENFLHLHEVWTPKYPTLEGAYQVPQHDLIFFFFFLTFLNDKNKSSRWKFTQFRNMLKKLFIIVLKIFK